jgi:hypothetical protein
VAGDDFGGNDLLITGEAVMIMRSIGLAAAALLLAAPALAAPAAIVEDAEGGVAGVEAFDYVDAGRVIELKANGVLVLGYLKSCVSETIRGGTVKVGAEQSEVTGGRVERKTNPCDGGRLRLTAEQAGKSGAMVFRKVPPAPAAVAGQMPAAQLTIYGTSPVVRLGAAPAGTRSQVSFERLDQAAPPIAVEVAGAKADLAKAGVQLAAGGLYRASQGERSVVVRIDPAAASGGGPVVGRLIQF